MQPLREDKHNVSRGTLLIASVSLSTRERARAASTGIAERQQSEPCDS